MPLALNENIQKLNQKIRICTNCLLYQSRKYAIPGEGPVKSEIMLIAQSPGKDEDNKNKMFVGPSGKIFDKILDSSGISRQNFYMTNLIKCMLPNSRRPSHNEIKECTKYLDREINLIQPKLIVPLGFHATRYIFTKYNIPRPSKTDYHTLFGKVFRIGNIRIYPVRHPTALLFNPGKREIMQKNYKAIISISFE